MTTTAWLGHFDATKAACAGSCCRLPKPTYTGKRPTWRACLTTPALVASTCPLMRSNRSDTGWTPRPGSSTRAVSASPPRSIPCSARLWQQADSGELILTGRLSLASHPWLADHKVHGVVLVPGAAMVEMALHAGDRAGCPRVDQLVLHTPMVIGEHGRVAVQVVVGAAG